MRRQPRGDEVSDPHVSTSCLERAPSSEALLSVSDRSDGQQTTRSGLQSDRQGVMLAVALVLLFGFLNRILEFFSYSLSSIVAIALTPDR